MRSYQFRFAHFVSLLTAIALLSSGAVALAQSTATIQGTITDQSGAALAGAQVVVRNPATGVERTAQTDSSGNYQMASLPVGEYRIEVQAQGFQPVTVNNLTLEVGRTVVQNFQMRVGGVSQTVNVTADAGLIETTTSTVGQGSFAFNTAGNREDTVNFMINGVNLNDMVQNQITFQPSINTVQEFKVDNSTFSAEYGRNSGAIVNIATRSGTNDFHGETFEFLRNEVFDARNFFDARKPPFKRNQFGAALGGPIRKDRTFFFFSYEGLRQRQGLTLNSGVLSDQQRAQVTDPISRRLLDFIPQANSSIVVNGVSQARFLGSATAPVNLDQWTGDVTHTFSQADQLHAYYAVQRDERGEPTLQGNTIPAFGDTRTSRRQIFTLNETHTFGPSTVNEARFGFNRIHILFMPNQQLNPADLGINNGFDEPIGIPQISVGGIGLNFGGPSGFPQGRGDTTFVFSDTLSYLHGRHALKFGGEFRRFLNNNIARNIGTFGFASVPDFQAGRGNSFSVTLGDSSNSIATGALGFFVQDSFKWKPHFTLDLGLRYDWLMTPTERYDRFVVFDAASRSLVRVGQGRDQIYDTSLKNLQPRVGFVWDLTEDGKTVLRGGYSILTDQPVTNSITGLASNPPLATPLTFNGTIRLDNALTVARVAGLAPASINPQFDPAYVQSYNLNLQREITGSLAVQVGYFGSKGSHLRISRNLNQFVSGVRPFATLPSTSAILPGAAVGNIALVDSGGNSNYNALWVTATKRLSYGLQFNASYTLSKSIDYNSLNSQGVVVQDSNNIRGDRGLSDYDARHRFVVSAIYELPFKGRRLTEGWQFSTITQLQSGNPVNILAGNPLAIPGTSFGALNIASLTGLATLRPDVIGPITVTGHPTQWFTSTVCDPRSSTTCPAGAAFALPVSLVNGAPVFHFGNLGRNVIIGPGFANTDFSVLKTTKLTENVRVQFRAEFFDLFNHANFGQPGRVAQVGSTTFGVITSTRFATGDSGSSRQVQFALKLIF